jgi:Thiopurine S-methyltransferase (TPMT)
MRRMTADEGLDFWQGRWRAGRIGFHEGKPNAKLVAFFGRLAPPPGARILVPLCGKAEDMAWLASQGLRVTGVELVGEAAEAFFAEHGLTPRDEVVGPFRRLSAGGVESYVGDIALVNHLPVRKSGQRLDGTGMARWPISAGGSDTCRVGRSQARSAGGPRSLDGDRVSEDDARGVAALLVRDGVRRLDAAGRAKAALVALRGRKCAQGVAEGLEPEGSLGAGRDLEGAIDAGVEEGGASTRAGPTT